jgi:hypothetical protein
MTRSKLSFQLRAAVIALLLVTAGTAISGQVTGAIFTTLYDGSAVDYNIYDAKQDVYLNGGPNSSKAPCTAAGLPNGEYYFQVTDPPAESSSPPTALNSAELKWSRG